MSDIKEEMKRIYKKAIEKDLERNCEQNLFVGRAIKLEEENKELQNRINKAIEYIEHEWFKREQIGIAPLNFSYEELQNVLNILKGDNK